MHLDPADLRRVAVYLAGDFSNREQAWENPPFYAQIRVCYRPLPWEVLRGCGFYVEQAYEGHLEDPYRTAVVELVPEANQVRIRNYRLLQPDAWRGAARQRPQQLSDLGQGDLAYLSGCDVLLQVEGEAFVGASEAGRGCHVVRKGRDTYLISTVRLAAHEFCSHDQGFDPETHEQIWGSLAGPFRFHKLSDYASDLPPNL